MAKNEPTKKPDQHRDSNPPWKRDFSLPSKQYIAYGSNLNVEQMKFRCTPGHPLLLRNSPCPSPPSLEILKSKILN